MTDLTPVLHPPPLPRMGFAGTLIFNFYSAMHRTVPPGRYLALRRLEQARELLANTDLSCGEVAQRCGFGDPHYFSRVFVRHHKMGPAQYRERTRLRQG